MENDELKIQTEAMKRTMEALSDNSVERDDAIGALAELRENLKNLELLTIDRKLRPTIFEAVESNPVIYLDEVQDIVAAKFPVWDDTFTIS